MARSRRCQTATSPRRGEGVFLTPYSWSWARAPSGVLLCALVDSRGLVYRARMSKASSLGCSRALGSMGGALEMLMGNLTWPTAQQASGAPVGALPGQVPFCFVSGAQWDILSRHTSGSRIAGPGFQTPQGGDEGWEKVGRAAVFF